MDARYSQYEEDFLYDVYMTDALKALFGLENRYFDLLSGVSAPETEAAPEEIIDRISNKLRAING